MKNDKKPHKKLNYDTLLLNLILSGLKKDIDELELNAITLSRIIKNTEPELSKKINSIIGSYTTSGNATRGVGIAPVPLDTETQLEMATIALPDVNKYEFPVLKQSLVKKIETFIQEREKAELLLQKNIRPTTSLLLIGPPGTGKTMLAYYIASILNKNLIILDLAASISSLLGKTGHNLKKVLKYARQTGAVLLLDEFDAIAKRRDDPTDLGELKRVVNVLLMELEHWPVSSVIIATSNHPDLLDKAIWRRFDHILEIELPSEKEILLILSKHFEDFANQELKKVLKPISIMLKGYSAADVARFAENVKRHVVLKNVKINVAIIDELVDFIKTKEAKGMFCKLSKKLLGDDISVRQLAEITGLSSSGVQYHLTGK